MFRNVLKSYFEQFGQFDFVQWLMIYVIFKFYLFFFMFSLIFLNMKINHYYIMGLISKAYVLALI